MRVRFRIALTALLLLLSGCRMRDTAAQKPTATPELEVVIAYLEAPNTDAAVSPASWVPNDSDAPAQATTAPVPTHTPKAGSKPTEMPRYIVPEGVYTIGWISDPQHYSAKFPAYYEAMTAFLRDQREALRLAYVINTGDLVHKTSDEKQWEVAVRAQAALEEIPNGVLAGNHDCQEPDRFEPYGRHFGEKKYKDKPWYGGSYQNNRGHYDLMTIGKTDYLFVYMSFGPDNGCIKWLNKVLSQYPDRVAFLCLHDYFTNEYVRSEDGEKLFSKVVKKQPNVRFVLCGHRYGAVCRPETLDDDGDGRADRTVYQMMFNYQAAGKEGGDGYLRLMQFDEANRTLHMLTYSPSLDDFNRFDDPAMRETHYDIDETAEEFTIPIEWLP